MATPADTRLTPIHPTEEDVRLARRGFSKLSQLPKRKGTVTLTVARGEQETRIDVPAVVFRMLELILDEIAQGHAVALAPVDREVSTQKAAEMLNVSRPFLVKLLEEGKIPFRKVGTHRRIRFADVVRYRARLDAEADRAFTELVAQAQELGMGYD